jgi:hypothetical protein
MRKIIGIGALLAVLAAAARFLMGRRRGEEEET